MQSPKVLKSEIDPSVNFVWDIGPGQAIEARYVRRHQDYVACYLSTQTACYQACRMCHLTATGQNQAEDVDGRQLNVQADAVLDYYEEHCSKPAAKVVHYNFMARGEPLSNPWFVHTNQSVLQDLAYIAVNHGLLPRFLISTILPESLPSKSLADLFPLIQPEIYYSLYSLDPKFRRRWLPRAMDPQRALQLLTEWQRHSKKIIRIHHALISGENDSADDALSIARAIENSGLRADFTLVRYNPPTENHGKESPSYQEYADILQAYLPHARIKTIQRVGFDVAASCGMFVNT